jgi:hypothetical protein
VATAVLSAAASSFVGGADAITVRATLTTEVATYGECAVN